jgi:hypothetical protein
MKYLRGFRVQDSPLVLLFSEQLSASPNPQPG